MSQEEIRARIKAWDEKERLKEEKNRLERIKEDEEEKKEKAFFEEYDGGECEESDDEVDDAVGEFSKVHWDLGITITMPDGRRAHLGAHGKAWRVNEDGVRKIHYNAALTRAELVRIANKEYAMEQAKAEQAGQAEKKQTEGDAYDKMWTKEQAEEDAYDKMWK